MGETTKIQWTDHTFNPWIGCTEVSPGCDLCYAREMDARKRWEGKAHWGKGVGRYRTSPASWAKVRSLDRAAAKNNRVDLVFCASLADVFDGEVPEAWRADLWDLIGETDNLVFQLLTKRPQNVYRMLPRSLAESGKVWVGASMENPEWFWNRLPAMAQLRAAYPDLVLYASYEPALELVDFRAALGFIAPRALASSPAAQISIKPRILDWVIVGGESDFKGRARPFDPEWARRLIRDAEGTGAKVFVKQMGTVWAKANATLEGHAGNPEEWPQDLRVRDFPAPRP